MSMVRQLIAAVITAERQIDEQIARLTSFKSNLNQLIEHVQSTLEGSQQNYADEMITKLQNTKSQVEDAISKLSAAKAKLLQVKMI